MPNGSAEKQVSPKIPFSINVFIKRLVGYGILFCAFLASILVVVMIILDKRVSAEWIERDERAQHFEGFSLSTPDPLKYWTWRTEAPERYLVKSDRIDTLLVQRGFRMDQWIGIGLKNGKTVVYLIVAQPMRRIIVNDASAYLPVSGFNNRDDKYQETQERILNACMGKLAEEVGIQGIQDLLTISRSYIRDTHASRDLLLVSDQMAKNWNRLHPDAAIKIPDIPKSESYQMLE